MSINVRKAAAAVLLLLSVSALSACAEIHPDNRPSSPEFRAFLPQELGSR